MDWIKAAAADEELDDHPEDNTAEKEGIQTRRRRHN